MTLLSDAVENKKFDNRVMERNVERGMISADDVDKNLKKLPDDAENAQYIAIDAIAADESGASSNGNGHH